MSTVTAPPLPTRQYIIIAETWCYGGRRDTVIQQAVDVPCGRKYHTSPRPVPLYIMHFGWRSTLCM